LKSALFLRLCRVWTQPEYEKEQQRYDTHGTQVFGSFWWQDSMQPTRNKTLT
jgi:hypothetical protein